MVRRGRAGEGGGEGDAELRATPGPREGWRDRPLRRCALAMGGDAQPNLSGGWVADFPAEGSGGGVQGGSQGYEAGGGAAGAPGGSESGDDGWGEEELSPVDAYAAGGLFATASAGVEGARGWAWGGWDAPQRRGSVGDDRAGTPPADCLCMRVFQTLGLPVRTGHALTLQAAECDEADRGHLAAQFAEALSDSPTARAAALVRVACACVGAGPGTGEGADVPPVYDARARAALWAVAVWLGMSPADARRAELRALGAAAVDTLAFDHASTAEAASAQADGAPERAAALTRSKFRAAKVAGASILGGTLLAVTGGLAAPALAGGFAAMGLGGAVTTAATAATASTAAVGATFGAAGAGVAGWKMSKRTGGLDSFGLTSLCEGPIAAAVCVNGWVKTPEDFSAPFECLVEHPAFRGTAEVCFLEWEREALLKLGSSLYDVVKNQAVGYALKQSIKYSALATLATALAAPAAVVAAAGTIDNVWGTTMDKAKRGGVLLAHTLLERAQGGRPVVLVGISLGARMVFACLEELARHEERFQNQQDGGTGTSGRGLVHHAILLGAPVTAAPARWTAVRSVVSGSLVNAYSRNDWLLECLTRVCRWGSPAAGLAAVQCAGVRNVDLSGTRAGRGDYSAATMARTWPRLVAATEGADFAFPAGQWDVVVSDDEDEDRPARDPEDGGANVEGVTSSDPLWSPGL